MSLINLDITLPPTARRYFIQFRRDAQQYGKRPVNPSRFTRLFTGSYKAIADNIIDQLNQVADQKREKDRINRENSFAKQQITKAGKEGKAVTFTRTETGRLKATQSAPSGAVENEVLGNYLIIGIGAILILAVIL